MSIVKKIKSKAAPLWTPIKWTVFIVFTFKLLLKLTNSGAFNYYWICNLFFALLAIFLLTPGLFRREPKKHGLRGLLSHFTFRLLASCLLISLAALNLGGHIEEGYADFKAYQRLTPEQKRAFDLTELKKENEQEIQRKVDRAEYETRQNESQRLDEITRSTAAEAAKKSESINKATYSECVASGIKYFKDLGSFPLLSTGEDAVRVAKTRCYNTTTAFGPWN